MRIKKAGIFIIAAAIICTTPAVPAMAADTSESVQEIISDNEIDSLVSDPDKVVDIIMYVKNEAAKQDISDDQIRSLIQTAESTAGVSLSEEEENRIIKIVKQIKDSDIDEEQHKILTGCTNKNILAMAQKLSDMGIAMWIRHVLVPERNDRDDYLHRLADFIGTLKTVERVEVLPYHTLGTFKWENLHIDYPLKGIDPPTKERIENAEKILGAGTQ